MGLPPRVRGKAPACPRCNRRAGITPAHAGKRCPQAGPHMHFRDHPRTRGEKLLRLERPKSGRGSPPHTRGKDGFRQMVVLALGITPARAGKSARGSCLSKNRRDHPRACGEKLTKGKPGALEWGSPPRVRGKVQFSSWSSSPSGITPARAGKSFQLVVISGLNGDHPRACGEKFNKSSLNLSGIGSPPRVRGKA